MAVQFFMIKYSRKNVSDVEVDLGVASILSGLATDHARLSTRAEIAQLINALIFFLHAQMQSFTHLRRYAANDKIFKLFFLHPFLASTIYNNTIKNKFDIG